MGLLDCAAVSAAIVALAARADPSSGQLPSAVVDPEGARSEAGTLASFTPSAKFNATW
jgi:hypothetical protein